MNSGVSRSYSCVLHVKDIVVERRHDVSLGPLNIFLLCYQSVVRVEVRGLPRGSSVLTRPWNQLQTEFCSAATCQQWLCSFCFFLFSLPSRRWVGADREQQQLDGSLRSQCCGAVDRCWHGFLPISAFQPSLELRLWRMSSPQVSSAWKGRGFLKPSEVLFSKISPVYGKSVFISSTARRLVCLRCVRAQGRICSSIFISPARYAHGAVRWSWFRFGGESELCLFKVCWFIETVKAKMSTYWTCF